MPESVHRYFPFPIPIFAVLALVSVVIVPGRAQQNGNKPQSSRQSKTYERPTDPSLYVGSETCKTCHEDMPSKGFYKTYEDSPQSLSAPRARPFACRATLWKSSEGACTSTIRLISPRRISRTIASPLMMLVTHATPT